METRKPPQVGCHYHQSSRSTALHVKPRETKHAREPNPKLSTIQSFSATNAAIQIPSVAKTASSTLQSLSAAKAKHPLTTPARALPSTHSVPETKPPSPSLPTTLQPPAPSPKSDLVQVQIQRSSLAAFAKDFHLTTVLPGEKAVVPLELQRAEGGCSLKKHSLIIPHDGYYLLLWELGVQKSQGDGGQFHLQIGDSTVQLTHGLDFGYDAGQQITYLSVGDPVRIILQASKDPLDLFASTALFTAIRLG